MDLGRRTRSRPTWRHARDETCSSACVASACAHDEVPIAATYRARGCGLPRPERRGRDIMIETPSAGSDGRARCDGRRAGAARAVLPRSARTTSSSTRHGPVTNGSHLTSRSIRPPAAIHHTILRGARRRAAGSAARWRGPVTRRQLLGPAWTSCPCPSLTCCASRRRSARCAHEAAQALSP